MTYATEAATASQAISLSAAFVRPAGGGAGGGTISDLVSITCGTSWGEQVSQATITCLSLPSGLQVGDDVTVTTAINGSSHVVYRGQCVDNGKSYDGGRTVTVICRGILGMLQEPWGTPERVYGADLTDFERADGQVIINLLEACGVPSARHSIVNSVLLDDLGAPGQWLLGEIQDVILTEGQPPLDLANAIDAVAGYVTVDQLDGFVERFENSPAGSGTGADYTFTEGVDGTSIEWALKSSMGVINQWTVTGLVYEGVPIEATASDTSAVLDALRPGTAPNINARTFQSELIETQNHAQRVADHKLSFTNRLQGGFRITMQTARPDLRLLDSVTVNYPNLVAPVKCLISGITHTIDASTGNSESVIETNAGTLALNAVVFP